MICPIEAVPSIYSVRVNNIALRLDLALSLLLNSRVVTDISAAVFARNEGTFEGQNDIWGDADEILPRGCA